MSRLSFLIPALVALEPIDASQPIAPGAKLRPAFITGSGFCDRVALFARKAKSPFNFLGESDNLVLASSNLPVPLVDQSVSVKFSGHAGSK